MSYTFNPFSGKLSPNSVGADGPQGPAGPTGPQGAAGSGAGGYLDWDTLSTNQKNSIQLTENPGFGTAGQFSWDKEINGGVVSGGHYFYLCIEDNVWRRQDDHGNWYSSW